MMRTEQGNLVSTTQSDLPPFVLSRPRDLSEAVALLAELPRPVVLHAGGTDLFAKFREGLRPASLVTLSGIRELRATRVTETHIELGAGLTHRAALADAAVGTIPGLVAAWRQIATVRIRHLGTLGGNLMARHTRYELSILMTALGAEARLLGPGGERVLPVARLWDADLTETPLLATIRIPREGAPVLDYERSQRPRFTQALCRRGTGGDESWKLVMGSEYLRPWATDFGPADSAAAVLERLPQDFHDVAVGRAHLQRAGAVFLRRQQDRMGEPA
ncbi:MAG: FAD binding domain-containing protein [Rhodobacteraceae bacterium]|nr:FAD binding domain-containing protein [Paracoccaceae bacterium]